MPPSKEQCWGAGQPPRRHQARPTRCSWRMVAERNDTAVPMVVWVESVAGQPEQSPAFASAFQVEQELEEQQRRKAADLRRFQAEVRQRVNRQVRMRRRLELQRCYKASVPTHIICGPGAGSGPAQPEENHGEPFQHQAAELGKAVKQVRRRLASRRTRSPWRREVSRTRSPWRREISFQVESIQRVNSLLPEADSEMKADPCLAAAVLMDKSEELLLAGHHDLPAELLEQGTAASGTGQDGDVYIKIEFEKVCEGSAKDSSLSEPPGRPRTEPPLILWAGADQEETRKQRQNEFLRCRRLFMAMERERVREQQRQRERQQRVAQIKRQKENQRRAEEQRMRDIAEEREPSPGEGTWEALAQLQLEERRVKDRQQRDKEHMRYVDALRAQMREKIKACNIDLPPLCSCGSDFWDSHPDTCANNCIFYKNHKAYSQVLHSVISSCAHVATRPLQDLAALCARSGKRL